MCWWKKNPDPVIKPTHRRLLTFGRNKYGGGNDLNGCINDSINLDKRTKYVFPDFDLRQFKDYDCTAGKYITKGTECIETLSLGATVLIMADSCFSGTVTRIMGLACMNYKHPTKNRFLNPGLPPREKINKIFRTNELNHIIMSGCQEHQTCADAYINGKYVGAFTYFACLALEKEMTYKEWFEEIRRFLPSNDFDQIPTLEGPENLLNRKVFEDETLIIHNSSHGSYTYDKNGDETDGQDEGIYLDRLLIDDEIALMLQNIPVLT